MRYQLLKLKRGKSTKAERIVSEILKRNRIKFRAKVVITDREIDFEIGEYALEIGNHVQDSKKNKMLIDKGYRLMTLSNKEIYENRDKLTKFLLNWLQK